MLSRAAVLGPAAPRSSSCSTSFRLSLPVVHSGLMSSGVMRPCQVRASASDSQPSDISSILAKYQTKAQDNVAKQAGAPRQAPAQDTLSGGPNILLQCGGGVGALLAVNAAVYALAVWGGQAHTVANLALSMSKAHWWQYITSTIVHASWAHLTRDLATIWLCGSLLRKELSSSGVWFTYLLCGVGANLSAMWLLPAKAKAAGGLLGVSATGGAAGLALTVLLLGFKVNLGYLVSAALFSQLLLVPMLTSPVPGGFSAAQPITTSLLPLFSGGSWLSFASAVKASLQSAAADPGLTWLWGTAAAALFVALLARLPLGDD